MAEVFSTKLFENIRDLHGKADQANAALKDLQAIAHAHLPVKFPAWPPDASLPLVNDLNRRVNDMEGQLDAIGLQLEEMARYLKQLVIVS